MLNDIDHLAKERLRIKHYVRYMDDIIIIDESREHLEEIKGVIGCELEKIGFQLHKKKTTIKPINNGFMFLGFMYRLTETGKVIMTVDTERVKSERRKLYRMAKRVKEGKMSREKVNQCYQSWKAHVSNGNSHKLILRMDKYYQSLWED